MKNRKTKIVCSLGPASSEDSVLRSLILAGMNVARINMSHSTHAAHKRSIEHIRKVSGRLEIPVAIMIDTKGPEIRTGNVQDNADGSKSSVTINKDDIVAVTTDDCLTVAAADGQPARISISWKDAALKMKPGNHILIADGLLDLEVFEVSGGVINCKAKNTTTIGSKKNVNLSGIHARLPIMSDQDKEDIAFGVEMDADYVAASFLSFPYEIVEIRKYLETLGSTMKVIAKIENSEGLENILKIAKASDGVMVARGDLGVQLPTEQIPLAQKHIISVCRKVGKPVITATQMLESMIVNPRPTRAELTDVANAIFDGTDAVMLSGETAAGAYPVEAVKMMDKIARTVEDSEEFRSHMRNHYDVCFSEDNPTQENLGKTVSRAGVEVASSIKAKAIVTPTLSGNTAHLLSVYRPEVPVLAVTPDKRTERLMQLFWGVKTCLVPQVDDTGGMVQNALQVASDMGIAGISDKIVLVAGLPLHGPYMVNSVRVLILGTVLARSSTGGFANQLITRVQGKIIHAMTPNDARNKLISSDGDILLCKILTKDYIPIVRVVRGIICEEVSDITDADLCATNPDLVWLTHIRHAAEKLESGLAVTIDAEQLLVYEGSI